MPMAAYLCPSLQDLYAYRKNCTYSSCWNLLVEFYCVIRQFFQGMECKIQVDSNIGDPRKYDLLCMRPVSLCSWCHSLHVFWHFGVVASIGFNIATSFLTSCTTNPGHCSSFLFKNFKDKPRLQQFLIYRHHGKCSDGSGKTLWAPRERMKVSRSGHKTLQR